jgi:PPP family 3-phenylpropionic acid transporter
MQVSVILFLVYAVGSVIYAGFPLVFRNMGYTSGQSSFLLTIFEIAGLVIPLMISPFIEKSGKYGRALLLLALLSVALAAPFVMFHGLGFIIICLAGYATSYRMSTPVSDSIANRMLGTQGQRYGFVRAMGSLGFVTIALLFQFGADFTTAKPLETIIWLAAPAVALCVAIIVVPGVLTCSSDTPRANKHTHIRLSLKELANSGMDFFRGFSKHYWAGMLLIFLAFLGLSPANRLLSLYVEDYLNVRASSVMWALSAGAEIPAMLISNRFIKTFGVTKTMSIATATIVLRLLMYVIVPNIYGAMAAQLLHFFNYGLFHPAAVYFVTRNAPRGKLMISLSIYSLCANSLANILGCFIGGFIIDAFGFPTLFVSFSALPVIALVAYNVIRRRI